MFEKRGVFFVPLNKKKTNEVTEEDKENFVIVCSKCGECYHKKCEQVHSQFFKDEKRSFFGNVLHVNDRLSFTFDIKCKQLLDDFY